jgi:hypothetical protein
MATNGLNKAEEKMLRDDLRAVERVLARPMCLGSDALAYRSLQSRLRTRLELENPQALHEAVVGPVERATREFYWMGAEYDEEFEHAAA